MFISACSQTTSAVEATQAIAPPIAIEATPERVLSPTSPPPSPIPTTAASPTPTSTPEPLSENGPWWVFFTGDGIWADGLWGVNPDGSGLTQLSAQTMLRPRDLRAAVSPVSGDLALITAADAAGIRGLSLNILALPGGEIRSLSPLASADLETDADADPALRPPEPLIAIVEETSLAWSPDGRHLAFIGAQDGPSADLYVYSRSDDKITRLSDGPSQAIKPSWSPSGHFILHMGVRTLGTGAGYDMAGVWAARADDTGIRSLYDPSGSGDEVLVGWRGTDTFVVYTFDLSEGGNHNLREVDVQTGSVTILWEGLFLDAALAPTDGSIVVLVDERAAAKNTEGGAGVYIIDAGSSPVRILEDEPLRAAWSPEARLFFVRTEFGLVAITPSGDWNQIHDFTGGLPVSSPVEKELAWYGDAGLWVGNLISSLDLPQPAQIFAEPVRNATWSPDGEGVLFVSGARLFTARKPDWAPVLVREGLNIQGAIWVNN